MSGSPLTVSYTPDSDDAHTYYAWQHGRIPLPEGLPPASFHRDHIQHLNDAARRGKFDVVAISSVVYPEVAHLYDILAVGTSVGRGFGPVMVSREEHLNLADLAGERVAVGGHPTTGSVLAAMYCSGIEPVPAPYDEIADRVAAGEFRAGVMIHEELLYYKEKGLHPVMDLGNAWTADTGLPLPVGLNLVRKELGEDIARKIATATEASLLFAFHNPEETFRYASTFGRGCAEQHIAMFSNIDTVRLPEDVRRALRLMMNRLADLGAPVVDDIRIVEGETSVDAIAAVCG